jgi:hypothetical protein
VQLVGRVGEEADVVVGGCTGGPEIWFGCI